ncbi:MAG: hypothetical protein K0V04_40270, partial [Deltaproteobacteria bacterium]|nr:hypothetical protein [Deltaproteobacteria bacterium]
MTVTAGCGQQDPSGAAFDPFTGSGGLGTTATSMAVPTDGSFTSGDDGETQSPDTGDESPSDDTTTTGEIPIDCTPAWVSPWIGSPCRSDGDCSFEGGQCLLP